ncbi:MAG TPA: SMC-Scp complex subunit ScpB [Actinomycetota bacterium]|nr:SMC-Scp complex subunit ScpB [Actinomycetota bacterium]
MNEEQGSSPPESKIVESILLMADEPIPAAQIAEVLERPTALVEELLNQLAESYRMSDRGFLLRESPGGWRLYTSPDCAPWLERFVIGNRHPRLTPAALEVLAVIAYKGPLSRATITEIRGVDSDGVVKTLQNRGLIEELAPTGSGAVLFRLSDGSVERLGLRSLDELPPLVDFMPDAEAVEDMESKLSPSV